MVRVITPAGNNVIVHFWHCLTDDGLHRPGHSFCIAGRVYCIEKADYYNWAHNSLDWTAIDCWFPIKDLEKALVAYDAFLADRSSCRGTPPFGPVAGL